MFIDLTKTSINSKIILKNNISEYDFVTFTKLDETFTFKTNHTLQNEVELVTKQATNSFGVIKPFLNNTIKESDYINIHDLYGIYFSSKGALGAFYLKNNVNIGDSFKIEFNSSEYIFEIQEDGAQPNGNIHVRKGNTKAESALLISLAINDTLINDGITAINYDNVVVLLNNDSEIDFNRNAETIVTFNKVAELSDSISFTYLGVTYTYTFDGTTLQFGTTKEESCRNLSNAINNDDTLPKIFTSVADNEKLLIYTSVKGVNGNNIAISSTTSLSNPTFNYTSFSGGLDSALSITNYSNSFGIQELTNINANSNKLGIAIVDSAIRSLSNDLKSSFDETTYTSSIEYLVPNINLPIRYYGEAFTIEGLSGALPPEVDLEATTTKLYEKLESISIACEKKDNVIDVEFSSSEIIEVSNGIDVINFSKGSMENPMGWLEFSTYVETISKNNVNIEATFINGNLMDLTPLSLDEYTNSSLAIKTILKPFTYGNEYPFVVTNSNNFKVFISGMFKNECNVNSNSGLIKIENCSSAECTVFNCEDTHLGNESFLVRMNNCSNGSLEIKNSTFTQSNSSFNCSLFNVSGSVTIKSLFSIYDGKERNTNNAFYLNANCYLVSSYDCFSKITPSSNMSNSVFNSSKGVTTQELDCDDDLVIDRSNSNSWSLNLTQNSRALLINGNDKNQPNDIFGNKRYLEKDFCRIQITVKSDVTGIDKFVTSNYIELDGIKKYFGSDLPLSYASEGEFANAVRDAFISSKYKIGIENNIISILGTNDIFNSNLGSNLISVNYNEFEGSGADAGSRQKHTLLNLEYKVDLSSNDSTCLSLDDMKTAIESSYPCYGTITFNLKNSNSTNETIRLGCDSNNSACSGYCNFRFVGEKKGKEYVSTLKANLIFGSNKFLTFFFDGIIHEGKIEEITNVGVEEVFIDIIFVNSILKWNTTTNPITSLRILESTVVENTYSDNLTVVKEFIISGCVVKYKFNVENDTTKTKKIFRFNYVINGYEPYYMQPSVKDEDGTIIGSDCLVDSSGTTINDFALVDGSEAISLINDISDLCDSYSSNIDILGNYRCSENVKDNLDCGAYEKNIVTGKSINFIVNLDSGNSGNGGVYAPCSLEEVYEKINQLDIIDVPIYIELNGYCFDVPKFNLNKEFTDNGSINFIGNINTIIDCVSENDNDVFNINSENATISFSNLIIRKCLFKGTLKKLVFSSCALVNTTEETMITCDSDCYFYGCSLQSNDQAICSSNSYVIGCSAQAKNSVALFSSVTTSSGNVYYNGSIPNGNSFNSEIMGDAVEAEILNYGLFELTESSAKGLVSISSFGNLYDDAESYNYNEDIRGFYRFDENQNTDSGCYDSLGTNDVTSFREKPNGQYTILTDEGSSLITRMILGKLTFKIVGFALGKGGYSKRNPIASVPITNESIGTKAEYVISLSSNSINEDDGIVIGNVEIRAITDFDVKDSIENTLKSLIEYINKNNYSFFAETSTSSSIKITALTNGDSNNEVVSKIGNKFSVNQSVLGTNSNYGVDLFYPSY